VERPVKELKAFKKVILPPGETRNVTLTIGTDALSFRDEQANDWRAEAGQFDALIGTARDQLPQRVRFTLQ
jgi:beta-glucosidase